MQWEKVWHERSPKANFLRASLLPISLLYALGWKAYESVYKLGIKKKLQVPIPIIGVGGLEVGGQGKTPITIAVAELLRHSFPSLAISASGYRSKGESGATLITPEMNLSPSDFGDEACLLREHLPWAPLIIGRDRVLAAKLANKHQFDVLLLDDGFQHLPLARTVDFLVLNLQSENRLCLPAGPYREPFSGLRRTDAFLMEGNGENKNELFGKPVFYFSKKFESVRNIQSNEIHSLDWLMQKEVHGLCAIANPQRFFHSLSSLGAKVIKKSIYADHDPLKIIINDDLPTIVTEKDAVKLKHHGNIKSKAYALRMSIKFRDETKLLDWLTQKIKSNEKTH